MRKLRHPQERQRQGAAARAPFRFDIADIAEVWRRGSVIPSWLLDLTATALARQPTLDDYSGYVEDSGEGRWTVNAAIDEAVRRGADRRALCPLSARGAAHLRGENPLRHAARASAATRAEEAMNSEAIRSEAMSSYGLAKQGRPDPCSFVIFGVTATDSRLVIRRCTIWRRRSCCRSDSASSAWRARP